MREAETENVRESQSARYKYAHAAKAARACGPYSPNLRRIYKNQGWQADSHWARIRRTLWEDLVSEMADYVSSEGGLMRSADLCCLDVATFEIICYAI